MNNEVKNSDTISVKKLRTDNKIIKITSTAIFATLIAIMTAYVCHIPLPSSGGYIHIGDSLIYLAASVLAKPYAMLAAAIGGAMADLLTAPMWIVPTFIIKALIVIPFSNKGNKILSKRNILATVLAFIISTVGYYIASKFFFGSSVAFVASLVASFMQGAGSAIVYIFISKALDKGNIKNRIFKFK